MRLKVLVAILGLSLVVASASVPAQAGEGPEGFNPDRWVSAARAEAIDTAAARFLAQSDDGTPGLWLAVWDPKRGYYEQAYGRAVAGGRKASVTDVTYIGSITKSALATAVLRQVAHGTMKLSDTVADLDPALVTKFPTIGGVDIRSLLGMTSGIPDYAEAAALQMLENPQQRFTRDDLIALGLASGEQQPMGVAAYSTTNYLILGQVLEAVTRRSAERLVNDVFRQAGMLQARLPPPGAEQPTRLAHGYFGRLLATEFPGMAVPAPGTDVTSWRFDWGREGGGAYATIGDLARWGSTCLGNSLLPKKLARQRGLTSATDYGNYGLGVIQQGDWLSHSGQVIGWTATVACNPKTGGVVAYATNSTNGIVDVPAQVGRVAFPEYIAARNGRG